MFGLIRRRAIDLARRNDRRSSRETLAHENSAPEWFAPEIEDRERARSLQYALERLSVAQLSGGEPVRFRCREWQDDLVIRDDAGGDLLFDGLMETPEQQQKVPKEVWAKVQPMLDQMDQPEAARGKTLPPADE